MNEDVVVRWSLPVVFCKPLQLLLLLLSWMKRGLCGLLQGCKPTNDDVIVNVEVQKMSQIEEPKTLWRTIFSTNVQTNSYAGTNLTRMTWSCYISRTSVLHTLFISNHKHTYSHKPPLLQTEVVKEFYWQQVWPKDMFSPLQQWYLQLLMKACRFWSEGEAESGNNTKAIASIHRGVRYGSVDKCVCCRLVIELKIIDGRPIHSSIICSTRRRERWSQHHYIPHLYSGIDDNKYIEYDDEAAAIIHNSNILRPVFGKMQCSNNWRQQQCNNNYGCHIIIIIIIIIHHNNKPNTTTSTRARTRTNNNK